MSKKGSLCADFTRVKAIEEDSNSAQNVVYLIRGPRAFFTALLNLPLHPYHRPLQATPNLDVFVGESGCPDGQTNLGVFG